MNRLDNQLNRIKTKFWQSREALGLHGILNARRMTNRLTRKLQDGSLGQPTIEPEDNDMSINLGDAYDYSTKNYAPSSNTLPWVLAAIGITLASVLGWKSLNKQPQTTDRAVEPVKQLVETTTDKEAKPQQTVEQNKTDREAKPRQSVDHIDRDTRYRIRFRD